VKRDTLACAESWADELLSRASRVRQLIGDVHWLCDGFHKEEIVREFLRRHLPPSLRISRGFVCPIDEATRVSREVDILITDTESELPWLIEGGLAIVPPSSVVAHLHIKTTFSSKTLRDVFESSMDVYRSCDKQRAVDSIWSCGVFFDGSATTELQYIDQFETCIEKFLQDHTSCSLARHLPDCIVVIDGPVLLINKDTLQADPNGLIKMRLFECGKLSVAVLLTNLYDSIQHRGRDLSRRGEWVRVVQKKEFKLIKEITISAR
jgi:hypothetical protein